LGAARQRVKSAPVLPQPSKGIFFNMETNYLKQLEDALINAAIEKQIDLARNATDNPVVYISSLEHMLRYKKRDFWIKRGIEFFIDEEQKPFK
jgi:hypothetical protein